MISYGKRENVFEKQDHLWTVGPDSLVWTRPDGFVSTLPWTVVAAVRLTFAPTEWKTWRYKLTLTTRKGMTMIVDNVHFKGVGDFEDRSASFGPFVLACVERIAAVSPGASARLGAAPAAYWAQVLFMGSMMALLAFVLLIFPIGGSGLVWVKLGLIAMMLPVALLFIVRSWPRKIALDPEAFREALPKREAPDGVS